MTFISVLTLLVLTATLIAIIWYTRVTQQIARASVEQSEALQKPCVVIESSARTSDQAVLEAPLVSEVAQTPNVQLRNIGGGPAVKLNYELRQVQVPQGVVAVTPTGFVPYLEAGKSWTTVTARGMLTTRIFEFSANYESLSGSKYQTSVRLENGLVSSSVFTKTESHALATKRVKLSTETVAAWLAVVAGLGALYLAAWSIHDSRDMALEAEEHRMASDFAKDDESGSTKEIDKIMYEFEVANWNSRLLALMHDSLPMRILMHGELQSSREFESKMLVDYRKFELKQFQQNLDQTLPQELEKIIQMSDSNKQRPARKLARILMVGYFAKRFKSCQEGEQNYINLITDPKKREQLVQLFSEITCSI
jgi:hypothetical protein